MKMVVIRSQKSSGPAPGKQSAPPPPAVPIKVREATLVATEKKQSDALFSRSRNRRNGRLGRIRAPVQKASRKPIRNQDDNHAAFLRRVILDIRNLPLMFTAYRDRFNQLCDEREFRRKSGRMTRAGTIPALLLLCLHVPGAEPADPPSSYSILVLGHRRRVCRLPRVLGYLFGRTEKPGSSAPPFLPRFQTTSAPAEAAPRGRRAPSGPSRFRGGEPSGSPARRRWMTSRPAQTLAPRFAASQRNMSLSWLRPASWQGALAF